MRNKFAKFATLAVCAGFASCSEYDAGIAPIPEKSVYETVYESAFIQTFGQPAANQDWGFGTSKDTRAIDANANQWSANWDVLPNVTDEERQKVLNAFNSVPLYMENETILPWENYWVHHVYTGTTHYKDGYDNDVLGSGHMDHMIAYNADRTEEQIWDHWDSEKQEPIYTYLHHEHSNNFNAAGNMSGATDEYTGYEYIGAMLMTGMNPEGLTPNNQFGFKSSTDSKFHFTYLILKVGDYYYVGFDFEATGDNPNQKVERDGRYTDWIVRISPAYPKNETPKDDTFPKTYWVIAEDLTIQTSTDFDFNDVVYEVKITDAETAQVTVLAAGGTLPIYIIDHNNKMHEAHQALGAQATNVPINVGTGVTGKAQQPIVIKGNYKGEPNDAESIVVKVDKNGELIELTAVMGEVASKICVPVGFDWCNEMEPIYNKYPLFNDWVQEPSINWTNIEE